MRSLKWKAGPGFGNYRAISTLDLEGEHIVFWRASRLDGEWLLTMSNGATLVEVARSRTLRDLKQKADLMCVSARHYIHGHPSWA